VVKLLVEVLRLIRVGGPDVSVALCSLTSMPVTWQTTDTGAPPRFLSMATRA